MAIGQLCKCKSNNNGEPLFFWERWKLKEFLFYKGVQYTYVYQKDGLYVITSQHVPVKFDEKYFKYLFKI